MMAIELLIAAPLCAVVEDDDAELHAVGMENLAAALSNRGDDVEPRDVVTECGKLGAIAIVNPTDDDAPTLWPPQLAPLRKAGGTRCTICHRATGRMRPRSLIVKADPNG